jgi:hypothetical protein
MPIARQFEAGCFRMAWRNAASGCYPDKGDALAGQPRGEVRDAARLDIEKRAIHRPAKPSDSVNHLLGFIRRPCRADYEVTQIAQEALQLERGRHLVLDDQDAAARWLLSPQI